MRRLFGRKRDKEDQTVPEKQIGTKSKEKNINNHLKNGTTPSGNSNNSNSNSNSNNNNDRRKGVAFANTNGNSNNNDKNNNKNNNQQNGHGQDPSIAFPTYPTPSIEHQPPSPPIGTNNPPPTTTTTTANNYVSSLAPDRVDAQSPDFAPIPNPNPNPIGPSPIPGPGSRATSPFSLHSFNSTAHHSLTKLAMSSSARISYKGGGAISPSGASSSQILQPITWSEMADEDLVGNLGGRERTRQEVLWEIVGSEERYVEELKSFKELYVDPLLNTQKSPEPPPKPSLQFTPDPLANESENESLDNNPNDNNSSSNAPPVEHLPIASRFMHGDRRSSFINPKDKEEVDSAASSSNRQLPEIFLDNESSRSNSNRNNHPMKSLQSINQSSTVNISSSSRSNGSDNNNNNNTRPNTTTPSPSLPKNHPNHNTSNPQQFRHYLKNISNPPPKKLHKHKSGILSSSASATTTATGVSNKNNSNNNNISSPAPVLPESLRIVLETIGHDLLHGHLTLSTRLKEKYYEQYPLVRSLTDVWADQSWIVKHYGTYVLHLERALEQVEYSLSLAKPSTSSAFRSRDKDSKQDRKLTKAILKLEEQASMAGEGCLVICLSKPLMRLLKYPLLFQSLLYYSDAASPEYESTKEMAIEIDSIVKSIESEKISEEERLKVRDVWSRIDGFVGKDLNVLRSDRTLISEEQVSYVANTPQEGRRTVSDVNRSGVNVNLSPNSAWNIATGTNSLGRKPSREAKNQKSFRRLSDLMSSSSSDKKGPPSMGSKRDIWLIKFSDVILRCQRVGVTTLPIGSAVNEKPIKEKKRSNNNSSQGARPSRNLYRFIKIESINTPQRQVPDNRPKPSSRSNTPTEEVTTDNPDGNNNNLASPPSSYMHDGGPSRMSFSYQSDNLKPATNKENLDSQNAKFSNRLRPVSSETSPALDRAISPTNRSRSRFDDPTAASLARVSSRPVSPIPPIQQQQQQLQSLSTLTTTTTNTTTNTVASTYSSAPTTTTTAPAPSVNTTTSATTNTNTTSRPSSRLANSPTSIKVQQPTINTKVQQGQNNNNLSVLSNEDSPSDLSSPSPTPAPLPRWI